MTMNNDLNAKNRTLPTASLSFATKKTLPRIVMYVQDRKSRRPNADDESNGGYDQQP